MKFGRKRGMISSKIETYSINCITVKEIYKMSGLHLTAREVGRLEAAVVGEVLEIMGTLYLIKKYGRDTRPWKGDIGAIASAHDKIAGAVYQNRGYVITTPTKNLLRDAAQLFKANRAREND